MILACGEALIDMLPRQSTKGEDAFAPYPGGAVFNTAIGLGRLGVETGFLCGMSSDFLGDLLRDALTASKVDHSPSPKIDAPCTVAFVKLVDGQATCDRIAKRPGNGCHTGVRAVLRRCYLDLAFNHI